MTAEVRLGRLIDRQGELGKKASSGIRREAKKQERNGARYEREK